MPRLPAFVLFLACSPAAFGQPATSWVSSQWTPMTEENSRAFQQADAQFKSDVEADWQKRVDAARAPDRARRGVDPATAEPSDGSVLVPGGGQKPLVPRGKRWKPAPPSIVSLQELLPASLEFAAPTSGGLIVQRTSGSVLFGRTNDEEVVVLPIGGESDLPHGMRGSIREEGRQLRLVVQLPTGQVVEYRYFDDPGTPERAMGVDIRIIGALPGKNVEFRRLYRRAQASDGEVHKAGQ